LSGFGWVMLVLLLGAVALFAATVRIGPDKRAAAAEPAPDAGARPLVRLKHRERAAQAMAEEPAMPAPAPSVPRISPAGEPTLSIPVAGVGIDQITDSYGDPRGENGRTHEGTDIMAPSGTKVLAAAPGTIEKLYFSKGGGGITVYQRSAGGGWMFYYAHLGGYAPDLKEGMHVKAGDVIGYVGDTGNAAPGVHHLHFGVSRLAPGDGWWQGTPVDPYPLLAQNAHGG